MKQRIHETEIEKWLSAAENQGLPERLHQSPLAQKNSLHTLLYPLSIHCQDNATYALLKLEHHDVLGVFFTRACPNGFQGTEKTLGSHSILFCPLTHPNAAILREYLPFSGPTLLANSEITFGVGDRLGIATPGHIRVFKQYDAAPVFAQQSVRELTLTNRCLEDVLDAATWSVLREGYRKSWGADGDHIKEEKWVKEALSLGYTMITADVSDCIRDEYVTAPASNIVSAYKRLPARQRTLLEEHYLDRFVVLKSGRRIRFSKDELARLVLTYGRALDHAKRLYQAGVELKGSNRFDFELSIDEISIPTTPEAHIFIALELERYKIKVVSVAPRFTGEFQKGIDYIGDLQEFQSSLRIHAEIARAFGYKLSVHSGSDKFLVFPIIGRETEGKFHIKTAGTSWLEALRVVSEHAPSLFRAVYERALKELSQAQKYYRVSPDRDSIPKVSLLNDAELPRLLTIPAGRQLLHITYGQLLQDSYLKSCLYTTLYDYGEQYYQALVRHIGRHLELLGVPRIAFSVR